MAIARQGATFAKGRLRSGFQAAAAEAGEVLAGMIQPYAKDLFAEHRAAGRPLVLATTTPYDLVKPLADCAGVRRRRRHPLRRGRRRHVRRQDRRAVRVGQRQARRRSGMGRRARDRPGRELVLLRQRVRHAPAVRGGPPRGGQPRSEDGAHGDLPRLAPHPPRRATGCSQAAGPQRRAPAAGAGLRPARALPLRPVRHHGRRADPEEGRGHHRGQPPLVLRRHVDEPAVRQGRAAGAVPREEGGVRRPDHRRRGPGLRRHPRRPGDRQRRAAPGGGRGPRGRSGGGAHAPGHHPARAGLLRPGAARAAGARRGSPGW